MKMTHNIRVCLNFLLFIAGVRLSANPLEQAQTHYRAGEYSRVEAALAPLLEREPVPVEVLALSYRAARADGRVFTAERRVRELIRREGERDPRWIHEGALSSRDTGDAAAYLDRLMFFARQETRQTPELESALRTLSFRSLFPQAFRRYREVYGTDRARFQYGLDMLRRIREADQAPVMLELAADLLEHYNSPANNDAVYQELHGALESRMFGLQRDEVYRVMFSHRVHELGMVREMIRRHGMDLPELFALQDAFAKPLPRDLVERFQDIRRVENESLREQFARRYVRLEPLYREHADAITYRAYLWRWGESPETFLGGRERQVGEQQAARALDAVARKHGDRAGDLHGLTHMFFRPNRDMEARLVESEDARRALLRTHPAAFRPEWLREMVAGREEDASVLQALIELAGGRHDVRMELLDAFSRHGHTDLLVETARRELVLNPTTFNVQELARHFLSSDAVDLDTKLSVLRETHAYSRNAPRFRDLVTHRDNRARGEDAMRAFVAGLDTNERAEDPVLALLVQAANDGSLRNRRGNEPREEFVELLNQAFDHYGAPFPSSEVSSLQTRHMEELLRLFRGPSDRREGRRIYAEVVSPRLSADADWDDHIQFTVRDNGMDGLASFHVARAWGEVFGSYHDDLRNAWHPRGNTDPLFRGHFADMDPEDIRAYLVRNRRQWPAPFLAEQLRAALDAANLDGGNPNHIRDVLSELRENIGETRDSLPLQSLTRQYFRPLEDGRFPGNWEIHRELLALFVAADQRDEGIRAMVEGARAADPAAGINLIFNLASDTNRVPSEPAEGDALPLHRRYILTEVVHPLLGRIPDADAARLYIPRWVWGHFNWFEGRREASDEAKARYHRLAIDLQRMRTLGARGEDHWGDEVWSVNRAFENAVNEKDWPRLIATILHAGRIADNPRANHLSASIERLQEESLYEPLFLFAQVVNTNDPSASSLLSRARAQAAANVAGIYPVENDHPAFPLFEASTELAQNNTEAAWAGLRDNLDAFAEHLFLLPHSFTVWSLERLREVKGEGNMYLNQSRELSNLFLTRQEELPVEIVARVMLNRAEIFRELRNFDAARLEYQSIRTHPEFQRTPHGRQAMFRDVDLMIAMGNVSAAEGLIEYWQSNPDPELQVQADYFTALIAFNNNDDDTAREYLDRVFARDFTHTEARLLHGRWRLRTNFEVDNPEILLGTLRDRTILRPGQPLRITVQDRNLSVVGGGAAIPILVTTSEGGDRERLNLFPSTRDPRLFRGSIDTVLGRAVPGNRVLEVNGLDLIQYEIDPEFLRERGMESSPAKTIRIVDDATLMVSAGNLLTEAEQQALQIQAQMSGGRVPDTGVSTQVRPGNPFYVMVRDRDRSTGGASPSTVTVNVETRSGDRIPNFVLTEVEPYTGVFRGEVPTALPPPRAAASDTADGTLAGNTINFNREGVWRSRADGLQGKWIEADTMNSHLVRRVVLKTPNAEDISEIRLLGSLTGDRSHLGGIPERGSPSGGVELRTATRSLSGLDQYRRYFVETSAEPELLETFAYRGPTSERIHLRGAFYLEEPRDLTLHFIPEEPDHNNALRDAWIHVLVNGEQIASGRVSDHGEEGISVPLAEGGHVLELMGFVRHNRDRFTLGYEREDGTIAPLPSEWFSVEDNPGLLAFLSDRASITRTQEGFVAEFQEPVRLRSLRWVFDRYAGDAVTVSEFRVEDADGNAVLPGPSDFTDALDNEILEIAPGDRITVTYVDDVTTSGERRTLTGELGSRFTNGNIGFFFEELTATPQGMRSTLHPAYRFRPGDSFMVVVNDADEDISPEADTVRVVVTTRGGERLELVAREQSGSGDGPVHTGRFVALLRTTLEGQTGGDTIRVRPGDRLTAVYVDKENTNPGIPVERRAELESVSPGQPQVTLFHTWREQREDTGPEAERRLQQVRARPGNEALSRVFTWSRFAMPMSPAEVGAEEITVNVDAPFPFEVVHPSRAMHRGSALRMRAWAESEMEAANAEGREPEVLESRVALGRARGGLTMRANPALAAEQGDAEAQVPPRNATFGGVLNFELGSPGERFSLDGTGGGTTVVVRGNDRVHFQLLDDEDNLIFERTLQLASEGGITLMDSTFQAERTQVHLGERFFVRVIDTDRDVSPAQDEVVVRVEARRAGTSVDLVLRETLRHSGEFTGVIVPRFQRSADDPAPTASEDEEEAALIGIPTIDVAFGDEIVFTYQDETGLPHRPPQTHASTGTIFEGADGKLFAFTKRFDDPEMAVRVQFRLAEALFEMAKDYRRLDQRARSASAIAEGKRILEEALLSYPETGLVVQGEYLLANLYRELGAEAEQDDPEAAREFYQEALSRFSSLLSNFPDSEYAPRALFNKALSLEKLGDFAAASEEYVKMTYIFPDSPLVGDAAIRLATHFYRHEQRFDVAGRIFSNFYHRFPGHELAPRALFMSAQSHLKQAEVWEDELRAQGLPESQVKTPRVLEEYRNAVANLQTLIDDNSGMVSPDVRAQAMYWAGDASLRGLDFASAYIFLRRTTFEYPESEWARRARGILLQSASLFEGLD